MRFGNGFSGQVHGERQIGLSRRRLRGIGLLGLALVAAWLGLPGSGHGQSDSARQFEKIGDKADVSGALCRMPLAFTENRGQWPDSILYRANAGGATMWFTATGAYYQFTRRVSSADGSSAEEEAIFDRRQCPARDAGRDGMETMMIKAGFVGANPKPTMSGDKMMEYKCNYFIGNDKSKWRTDVPNYEAIVLNEVYPGIDLTYYGNGHQMEYDFVVSPGADYSQIRIQVPRVRNRWRSIPKVIWKLRPAGAQ